MVIWWLHLYNAFLAPSWYSKVLYNCLEFTHSCAQSYTNGGCCHARPLPTPLGAIQCHVVSCPRAQRRTRRERNLNCQSFGQWTAHFSYRATGLRSRRAINVTLFHCITNWTELPYEFTYRSCFHLVIKCITVGTSIDKVHYTTPLVKNCGQFM